MDFKQFYSLNFLGRLLLSAIFINAIPGKISNFSAQAQYITSRGFPEPDQPDLALPLLRRFQRISDRVAIY